MKILFFGSTSDSCLVLEKLPLSDIAAIVTQPPKPIGRSQAHIPTPVEDWAKAHTIPVLSFASDLTKPWLYQDEHIVVDTLEPFQADLIVSASYGLKIPSKTISDAKYGGLNVHPSILPRWRGADPVPWAIITGDHQIGVTIVTLSDAFDEGIIVAQKKIPIHPSDTSGPLRTKLFTLGADLLDIIIASKGLPFKGSPQKKTDSQYARKLSREDGFEPWEAIIDPGQSERINRKYRAFHPWPGLWTRLIGGQAANKRLKILEFTHTPITVQIEGKQPVSWKQFSQAYLLTPTP